MAAAHETLLPRAEVGGALCEDRWERPRSLLAAVACVSLVLGLCCVEARRPHGQTDSQEDRVEFASLSAANTVRILARPASIANGGTATLTWRSALGYRPRPNDWIGCYCSTEPSKVPDAAYLNWSPAGTCDVSGECLKTAVVETAHGRHCEFRLFTYRGASAYHRVGTSNSIAVSAARHLHLALTGSSSEMLVQWASETPGGMVQFKPKLAGWSSAIVSRGSCHTYQAGDMCHSPATNSWGFVDPGQLCEAAMTGLTPDAEYEYRITVDDGHAYGDAFTFRAAPEIDPEYSFTYLVYGDMGTWRDPDHSAKTASLCTQEMRKGARMTHHFGDLSYACGQSDTWDVWMSMIEPYARLAPYMISIGNHEFDYLSGGDQDPSGDEHFKPPWGNMGDDSGGECGVPAVNRFHMPAERSGGNGVFWYSYDFGSLHTVTLSAEHNCSLGSAQYTWLSKDLASVDRTRTPWLVVEIHRPLYNNEKYAEDYRVAVGLQDQFEDLLVRYDVDLVLAGHYHSYLRSKRIYKDRADDARGIYHFTAGGAGYNPLDNVGLYDKDWVEFFDDDYGFGRITIKNSTALHWEFIRNKDSQHGESVVVDETWIVKRRS